MQTLQLIVGLSFLIGVAVHGAKEEEIDENTQMLVDYANECLAQENGSVDDAKDIIDWMMPGTREGQCTMACLAEKIGIIKEGKFSPEGTVNAFDTFTSKSDPDRDQWINFISAKAEECKSVENEDRCELVVELNDCYLDEN